MVVKEVRFHLVLRGSFYPFHKGHLTLFKAGKIYISNLKWSPNIKITVGNMYISPTHISSLRRKLEIEYHGNEDSREEQIKEFLVNRDVLLDDNIEIFNPDEDTITTSKVITNLKAKVEAFSNGEIIHSLVQLSGVDSKAVQAVVKSLLNSKFKLPNENMNDKDLRKAIKHLKFIIVQDGRETPSENQDIIEKYPHKIALLDIPDFEARDLLPRSSTIQRFINSTNIEGFDLDWLIDTGINLGKGRQALVRLMLLGGHQYVAVKVIRLDKKNRFTEESVIWSHLAKHCPKSIPKLFGIKKMTTDDGQKFGLIVTELGVPINDIFKPKVDSSDQKEARGYDLFTNFESLSAFTGTKSQTKMNSNCIHKLNLGN